MTQFKILQKDGKARVGRLTTAHGVIETPNWIPVGTKATVKALSPRDLKEIGAQIILANTYHLMLQPGVDVIQKLGGLHKFMGWNGPIMTDSGGFQVFSLGVGLESGEEKVTKQNKRIRVTSDESKPRLAKVTDEGVIFQSHIDGSKHFLGPTESIRIQQQLGADLMVAFDDHESIYMDHDQVKKSLELTENWGLMSLKTFKRIGAKLFHLEGGNVAAPLLYGVIHGALYKDLRIRSARFTDQNFEAIAIGGIYGKRNQLYQIVDWVTNTVSDEKIRHLLGIGEVVDLFNAVELGVDFFDCVGPTRRARNGSLYVSQKNGGRMENNFTINITSGRFTKDAKPVDPSCQCYTCQNFSCAYLHHLYKSSELLYFYLATYHNVYFINHLVKQIRAAIKNKQFKKFKSAWL